MSDIAEIKSLRCGRKVPTSLYESVRKRVLERASELTPGRPYKLRMICGEHYWYGLGSYYTLAGQVMADLVDERLVPFQFASERDEKPLWYWLKP